MNPNPARITAAMWWLAEQLLALAPGTQLGGIYALKAGYHATGDDNERNWPGNYSIRDAEDRRGLNWRTRAAAIDWTFLDAQRGDYRRIATYGARLKSAYDARDPRLAGWREALGQTDLDAPPEGLDFRGHYTRVPDDTHRWHWHFSEDREQVESLDNKRALLSILRGQTLAQWQVGDDMTPEQIHNVLSEGWSTLTGAPASVIPYERTGVKPVPIGNPLWDMLRAIAAKVDVDQAELDAITAAARAGAEQGLASGADVLADRIAERLIVAEDNPLGEADKPAIMASLRAVLGSLDNSPQA